MTQHQGGAADRDAAAVLDPDTYVRGAPFDADPRARLDRDAVRRFYATPQTRVTAINESLSMPCIHCGVTISSRQDFCPSCGYAQPVKQGFKAAFPA